MHLSHAWQSKEGHSELRRERHTSAQAWDGGGESGSQLCNVASDKTFPLSFCFPSFLFAASGELHPS